MTRDDKDIALNSFQRLGSSQSGVQFSDITSTLQDLSPEEGALIVARLDRLKSLTQDDFSKAKLSPEALKRLKIAHRTFAKLETALGDLATEAPGSLSRIFSEYLGRTLTRQSLKKLIGEEVPVAQEPARRLTRQSNRRPRENHKQSALKQAHINFQAIQRHPNKVVLGFIHRLHKEVSDFLKLQKAMSRRGPPADNLRRYRLLVLYQLYKEHSPTSPTSTPSGEFVTFCNDAFEYMGADTIGLERALGTIWTKLTKNASP